MMIKSSVKDYELIMHDSFTFMKQFLSEKNAMFIVDKRVYDLYFEKFFSEIEKEQLYLIEAVETKKNIETVLEICETMTQIPDKRNAHLISFGGGIIQDITGFAANVLYRGIKWTFIPTTLLVACDSCIGGKTSLNYKSYKNLLGTFYPPDFIHVCPLFFETLSEADFLSALGEVVKFNIMRGEDGLRQIEKDLNLLLKRDTPKLNEYTENSLLYKKDFIEKDEFDRGERIKLNFGHTFGHAFESMSNYTIPHGTAVAMGMLTANRISLSRGWLDLHLVQRMEYVLFQIIHVDISVIPLDMKKIIAAIHKDKKQINSALTAVLMQENMALSIVHDLKPDEAKEAIQYVYTKLL